MPDERKQATIYIDRNRVLHFTAAIFMWSELRYYTYILYNYIILSLGEHEKTTQNYKTGQEQYSHHKKTWAALLILNIDIVAIGIYYMGKCQPSSDKGSWYAAWWQKDGYTDIQWSQNNRDLFRTYGYGASKTRCNKTVNEDTISML